MPFIVDRNMRQSCIENLKKIESEIFFSKDCEWVYKPVNTHPDLQIHFADKDLAFVPPELFEYYRSILPDYIKIKIGNKSLGGTYPDNVAYNIARVGEYVVANVKYADENILDYYRDNNFKIINIRQGYAKCNICTDGKSVVTEDEGIYKKLTENGIETMLISAGGVKLENFPYGFIGGASGYAQNKILFCGDADGGNEISEFFNKNSTEILSLDKENLTDYGSVLYFE